MLAWASRLLRRSPACAGARGGRTGARCARADRAALHVRRARASATTTTRAARSSDSPRARTRRRSTAPSRVDRVSASPPSTTGCPGSLAGLPALLASGGALAHSPLLAQVLADALGREIRVAPALEGVPTRARRCWPCADRGRLDDHGAIPAPPTRTVRSDPDRSARYRARRARHDALYADAPRAPANELDGRIAMKVGVIVPQGWTGEYDGWDPLDAWRRTVRGRPAGGARSGSSRSGCSTTSTRSRDPTDEITFESFTSLAALAALTTRVRLGHVVDLHRVPQPGPDGQDDLDDGRHQRRPDGARDRRRLEARRVASPTATASRRRTERLARLGDDLEVITRMLAPATAQPRDLSRAATRSVDDAINVPKPIQQPRVPIMVGGNGPNVTWRLAARYADELNLDGMLPDDVATALPVIRVAVRGDRPRPGDAPASRSTSRATTRSRRARARSTVSRGYRELGVARTIEFLPASAARRRGARVLRRRHGAGRLRSAACAARKGGPTD